MNHSIVITVDGYSFQAVAVTTQYKRARIVSAVACGDIPTRVLGTLSDHVISEHDVLEIVRCHLNDDVHKYETTIGSIELSWCPLNKAALVADLSGHTFTIKVTDLTGNRYQFDIGARDSVTAWQAIKAHLPPAIRSSVVIPQSRELVA